MAAFSLSLPNVKKKVSFLDRRVKMRYRCGSVPIAVQDACDPMNQEQQVKINYKAFQEMLPALLKDENKYALLKDGELVAVYDTMQDALTTAQKMFSDGFWSIQKITDRPIDLGYRSRALHIR
jgi:hypothetical protein